jgi:hypothetical protein
MITTAVVLSAFAILFLASIALQFYGHEDAGMFTGLLGGIAIGAVVIFTNVNAAVLLKRTPEERRVMTAYQSCREQAIHDVCIKQALDRVDSTREGIALASVMKGARTPLSGDQLLQLRSRLEGLAVQNVHQP